MKDSAAAPTDARDAALREHAPLVRRIARRLRARLPASVEMDELMQAGLIGLHEAVQRFERRFGVAFDTYAARRIEGAMLDSLRAADVLSRDARARQRTVRAAVQALEHRLLRAPRAIEVAHELGWTLARLHDCLLEAGATGLRTGDAPLESHEASGHGADDEALAVVDEHADPQLALERRQRSEALHAAFDDLEARERLMMQLIYDRGLDHQDAARSLGVSPSRVSQMHAQVVAKLRRRLRDG